MSANGGQILKGIFAVLLLNVLISLLKWGIPTIAGESRYFPANYLSHSTEVDYKRIHEASGLYETYKDSNHSTDIPYSITIVTADRKSNYFIQVIGYLFGHFKGTDRPLIEVCNVAKERPEYVRKVSDRINVFDVKGRIYPNTLDERLEKENSDYWECLRRSDNSSRYVILFEDDAVPIQEFPRHLESLISYLDGHQHIDYVKLYHPHTLRKISAVPMGISFSLLASLIILYFLFEKIHRVSLTLLVIFTISTSLHIWKIGGSQFPADVRHFLTRSTYLTMSESCCTQAVLFRRSKVSEIVNELSATTGRSGHAKDHILDESRFISRMTDFNLVVHIGQFSTLRQKNVHLSDMDIG